MSDGTGMQKIESEEREEEPQGMEMEGADHAQGDVVPGGQHRRLFGMSSVHTPITTGLFLHHFSDSFQAAFRLLYTSLPRSFLLQGINPNSTFQGRKEENANFS